MATLARKLLDLEDALSEAERKVQTSTRLWQREWAATSLRAIAVGLSELDDPRAAGLQDRALALSRRLKALDEEEMTPLRDTLFGADSSAQRFHEVLSQVPSYEWDAFSERLLGINEVPGATQSRSLEMIKYQASPLASILEVVAELGPGDVLFDLGSGLGKVPMFATWLTPARAVGIELEPAYVECARARARALSLQRVRFECVDAREADYSEGTVFYFFFPFEGEVMSSVLDAIRAHTKGRSIRFASLHRSTLRFDQETWLVREATAPSGLAWFRSK